MHGSPVDRRVHLLVIELIESAQDFSQIWLRE
jgi:hypothetical protein